MSKSTYTMQNGQATIDTFVKEITLKNWRQFRGEQTIDLTPESGRNINALIGENGTGKTNLSKAVELCLNGRIASEEEYDDDDYEEEPHVSSEVTKSLSPGEQSKGTIKLRLAHRGTDYIIKRNFGSVKQDSGFKNHIGEEPIVQRHKPGGWDTVDNPNELLARILPPEVQQYYFYDGERLDNLFESGYETRVENAIQEMCHIEVLERGIDHLGKLRDERRRFADSKDGDVAEARESLNTKQKKHIGVCHKKAVLERNIAKKVAALEEIEDKMGEAADPETFKLISERERLESKIKSLKDDARSVETSLQELLVEAGTITLASEAITTAKNELDQLGARGELPPDVRRGFLTEKLKHGECICGCDLDTQPERRKQVKQLRDRTPDVSDQVITASHQFPSTAKEGTDRFNELLEVRGQLHDIHEERSEKERKRNELSEKLRADAVPSDVDLEELDKQREQLQNELKTARRKDGKVEQQLVDIKAEIEAAKESLESELEKVEQSKQIMREVEVYKTARKHLQQIKKGTIDEVRAAIEASLDRYFNELTWKDESYDVSIRQDFRIRIHGPDSLRQVERLSDGETAVLALSFIAALTEVSGFRAPILVDAPVGRIDQEHRAAIGNKIPGYLSDHQITFLFTDSEYDDTVAAVLEEKIANKYRFENDNRVTEIHDYTNE